MGIVVIGSVFVDIKGYPYDTYLPTGRNSGRIVQVHGGVSRNIAEDIANVELRPTYVSLVDDNGMGNDVIEKLKRHKVNTKYIRRVADGMGTWLAIFDNDGDVAGSISKRPNLEPIAQILKEEGDEIVKDCDSIVVEFDLENSVLKQVFALAEKYHKEVYAAVSNMSIAMKRRDRLQKIRCFVCNKEEAEVFFSDSFSGIPNDELARVLVERIRQANIRSMIVTLGGDGAIYADALTGEYGQTFARKVNVSDTTGAGDAFSAGVTIGLTYGKSLAESCEIGTRLAASVIVTQDNVCPRFRPEEFGLNVKVTEPDF